MKSWKVGELARRDLDGAQVEDVGQVEAGRVRLGVERLSDCDAQRAQGRGGAAHQLHRFHPDWTTRG